MSHRGATKTITERCMENNECCTFRFLIAGPCAAESEQQVYETARRLHTLSARLPYPITLFRCGVWKPRSRANAFCGAGEESFAWLQRITRDFGFPVCIEIPTPYHLEIALEHGIRHFWIGARTGVNPFSVQEIADAAQGIDCTVMVKNPAIPDLQLWLGNIERFERAGVRQVMAIHRGFAEKNENVLRNTPMWEIPTALHIQRPDLPIICDPSHISGNRNYVRQIAQIAINYGHNGLMIETHCDPDHALSDAPQQLTPEALAEILNQLVFKQSQSNTANLLQQQRTLIRNIDTQIGQLLSKRLSIVEEIAAIKHEHNIPLVQPAQWNSVVQNYEETALDDPRYKEFIEKYLKLLHQYSLKMQE